LHQRIKKINTTSGNELEREGGQGPEQGVHPPRLLTPKQREKKTSPGTGTEGKTSDWRNESDYHQRQDCHQEDKSRVRQLVPWTSG